MNTPSFKHAPTGRLRGGSSTYMERHELFGTDVMLTVEYNYIPGYPATGPTYSCGGEPACGPEVDILRITVQKLKVEHFQPYAFGRDPIRLTKPKYTLEGAPIAIDGELFDLIAGSEDLIDAIVQNEEDGQ